MEGLPSIGLDNPLEVDKNSLGRNSTLQQEQSSPKQTGGMITRSKTLRVKKNLNMSFNSSDIEAYKDEHPIPIVKEAFFEY